MEGEKHQSNKQKWHCCLPWEINQCSMYSQSHSHVSHQETIVFWPCNSIEDIWCSTHLVLFNFKMLCATLFNQWIKILLTSGWWAKYISKQVRGIYNTHLATQLNYRTQINFTRSQTRIVAQSWRVLERMYHLLRVITVRILGGP